MIDVKHLSVSYSDGTQALRDVTFHIGKEERVALVGTNGAGKSTLLLSLVGIMQPESGEITVAGMPVGKKTLSAVRAAAGMVFQNPDDQLFMTKVADDLAFGPRNYGVPEPEIEARIDMILADLRISHLRDRMPHKLSGGEKRSVALGSVLAMQPEILLLDEPSSFLDPRARRNMIAVLRELPQTKLIATHDLDMALDLCTRVLVLNDSTMIADGTPEEILLNEQLMQDCGLELPLSVRR